MVAIETRVLPATRTLPLRVEARVRGGKRIKRPWRSATAYFDVATELATELGLRHVEAAGRARDGRGRLFQAW